MKFSATATAAGIGITITRLNIESNINNTYEVYLDQGEVKQQYKGGLTGWAFDVERIIPWSDFSPIGLNGRTGGEQIAVKLIDTVTTDFNTAYPTLAGLLISASANSSGVTVTIVNFGLGSGSDPYNLYIDFTQVTQQIIVSTTGWVLNTPQTFPWSSFSPSTVPTAPIKISLLDNNNESLSNEVSTTVSAVGAGDAGGGTGNGAPCFVASSKLLTLTGYRAAADIKTGDLLMTADGRPVPVKSYSFTVEKTNKETAPFLIPKDSIAVGCPKADLRLSPWHAFQMKKGLWMKPMSALELGYPVEQYDIGNSVTYYHFEAPDYFKDNFICEGSVVESFGGLQTKGMKDRVYTYNASLKAYTRIASKSVSKTITM
jgi:hypothetical protein